MISSCAKCHIHADLSEVRPISFPSLIHKLANKISTSTAKLNGEPK